VTQPIIQTPAALVTQLEPFVQNANSLTEQAKRAEILTREHFAKAVDFIKICDANAKSVDEQRRALVDPLNAHVKWINAQFNPTRQAFVDAKDIMLSKAGAWKRAEDERVAKEAAEVQRLAEEQALRDAEAAQAAGDTARAEAIVAMAAETPPPPTTAPAARGTLTGALGSTRGDWKGDVADPIAACKAIAEGRLPVSLIREWSKSELNRLAQEAQKEGVVDGIRFEKKQSLIVK
jgi:hypothetical protein